MDASLLDQMVQSWSSMIPQGEWHQRRASLMDPGDDFFFNKSRSSGHSFEPPQGEWQSNLLEDTCSEQKIGPNSLHTNWIYEMTAWLASSLLAEHRPGMWNLN